MALLIIGSQRSEEFASAARDESPDLDIRVWPETGSVEDIRYALAWGPPMGALKGFPNLELIISVGAGVDHLMKDPELPDVPDDLGHGFGEPSVQEDRSGGRHDEKRADAGCADVVDVAGRGKGGGGPVDEEPEEEHGGDG